MSIHRWKYKATATDCGIGVTGGVLIELRRRFAGLVITTRGGRISFVRRHEAVTCATCRRVERLRQQGKRRA